MSMIGDDLPPDFMSPALLVRVVELGLTDLNRG